MNLDSLKVVTRVTGKQSNAGDLASPSFTISESYEQVYDDGTAAEQAQVIFADTRTIAATSSSNIDLAGGLPHPLGGTIAFTAIKELLIVAAAANTGNLLFGEGVASAFVGPFGASAVGLEVPPGGILHLRNPGATGWAVAAGSADVLAAENLGAGSADFDIIIVGEGTVA